MVVRKALAHVDSCGALGSEYAFEWKFWLFSSEWEMKLCFLSCGKFDLFDLPKLFIPFLEENRNKRAL